MNREVALFVTSIIGVIVIWWIAYGGKSITLTADDILRDVTVHPTLQRNGQSMDKKEVIKVTDGVYMAVNYAFANSIMLEGPDGLIIVDTTEHVTSAQEILREFRRISSKRIVAIIYTHNHFDHTLGTQAFIEDDANPPEIWGYESLKHHYIETVIAGPRVLHGASFQVGFQLGKQVVTGGIGRRANNYGKTSELPIFPTKLIRGEISHAQIAGLNVTFVHIPGETKDQIGVWLADKKVLLPADDIYRTFPNLYAIRGTPPRDSLEWRNSLAKMRSLRAEHLVPSHTIPGSGAQNVYDLFTVYMAGIQYVHDQTVRFLNKGLHPDDVSRRIKLPESIASHEYLQEFYGTTVWSSKGVYEQYIGWFSGDAVELFPPTPLERARLMVEMVGANLLLANAEAALKDDNPQWALELSSYVLKVTPDNMRAKSTRLEALRTLAGMQTNPSARNFYLSTALEDFGLFDSHIDKTPLLESISAKDMMNLLPLRVKAEEVDGVNITVIFHFSDISETFQLQLLFSVLNVERISASTGLELDVEGSFGAKVTMTVRTWKDIALKRRSAVMAYASGDLVVEGSVSKLKQFLDSFED